MATAFVALSLTHPAARPATQSSSLWVAFRYDDNRVLFYASEMIESGRPALTNAVRDPKARYGAGGYVLPLTARHFATLRPTAGTETSHQLPAIGTPVTVFLGGRVAASAQVREYVEQWGNSNPIVRVGALVTIDDRDRARFLTTTADYFLLSTTSELLPVRPGGDYRSVGRVSTLNRFEGLGELRLDVGEAGWRVTLFTPGDGGLRPTSIQYSYGD